MTTSHCGDREYLLKNQYADANKVATRIKLHQRYGINRNPWHRWVFEQMGLPESGAILEIGAGNGALWWENRDRLTSASVLLTDFSAGMVEATRQRLADLGQFTFAVVDGQSLDYPRASFDAVVANHMLYHMPDLERTLSEVARVLRPGARFYASTNGPGHLKEIDDLVARYFPDVPPDDTAERFGLETGLAPLQRHFLEVELRRYEDRLVITDADALAEYALSMSGVAERAAVDQAVALRAEVISVIAAEGAFHVRKSVGLFCCRARS